MKRPTPSSVALVFLLLGFAPVLSAADLTPEQIRDAYHRSYAYERTEDYDNAIKALSLVFREYPNGYTVNLRLGWLFYLKGNHANAISHYETVIRVAPYALEPKLGVLLPLLAQSRYADVEARAYQVVTVDYYSYYGNLRLAIALRLQGKLEQAQSVVGKMLIAYPTDPLYLTELGLIQQARGLLDAAATTFQDVIVLDPENPTAKAFFSPRK